MKFPVASRPVPADGSFPDWAQWHESPAYTVGLEEEVMLLTADNWGLAYESEDVLMQLPEPLAAHAAAETHQAVIELATEPHDTVAEAAGDASELRRQLAQALESCGFRAAAAGTHPLAVWSETQVSSGARYRVIHETMRELARREPTFALHVHVGVSDPERAIMLQNRLRAHLPLLLALSANSPFWQGRDTGMASARIPIFQAFPRVGVPRAFRSYEHYADAVDTLLRGGAFPAPTFLWWDVRLQPSLGTVEVRIMDAQTSIAESATLAALVQTIAHLELEQGYVDRGLVEAQEVIEENRFRAARDGIDAELLDPVANEMVPVRRMLAGLLTAGRDHAEQLGCADHLAGLAAATENGVHRQRRLAESGDLRALVAELSAMFAPRPLR